MICKNCGMPLPNGTLNCPNCGSGQVSGNVGAGGGGYTATTSGHSYGGTTVPAGRATGSGGDQDYNSGSGNSGGQSGPSGGKRSGKNKDIQPIDSNEKIIRRMMSSTVDNVIYNPDGSPVEVHTNMALLTDKRVYYSGKDYYAENKSLLRVKGTRVVDLQDITSTGFIRMAQLMWIILAILCCIIGVALMIYGIAEDTIVGETCLWLGLYILILALIFVAIYLSTRKNYYEITYAGGAIVMDVSKSETKLAGIEEFDECLRIEKDKCLKKIY